MADATNSDNELRFPGAEPESSGEDPGFLSKVKDWYKRSERHFADWRTEAVQCYDFVAGEQWSTEDKAFLEEQERPAIVFNRIAPVIDAILGLERSNRQEVRYIPRGAEDTAVTDLATAAAEWARDESDAGHEESEAFADAVIGGVGWVETRMDYDDEPDGRIVIARIDPLEMYPDPTSTARNHDDARYVIRVRNDVDLEEAQALWPDYEDEIEDARPWAAMTNEPREPHDAFEAKFYRNDQAADSDRHSGSKVQIVEVQYWERETYYRVADPESQEGRLVDMTEERYREVRDFYRDVDGRDLRAVKQRRKVYKRAFIIGSLVVEHDISPCPFSFTYRAITGKRDRNNGVWYGIVRAMRDPQCWANKWLSQTLHTLNTNATGGIIAERSAFEDQRQAEDNWARPDGIVWARDGAVVQGRITPKPRTEMPASMHQLLAFAVTSIRDVSGVNLELLGMADRQQAGILEHQRKQAGMTILAVMFDSLRRYRKEQGRVLLHFIREFISDGRLIRIDSESGQQYVNLLRQPETVKYDIIVDDAPSSPNQKERTWAMISELAPILSRQQLPTQLWAELMRYSPLPASLAQKISQYLNQAAEQASQPTPEQEMEKLKVESQAIYDQARAEEARSRVTLNQAKAQEATAKGGAALAKAIEPTPMPNREAR